MQRVLALAACLVIAAGGAAVGQLVLPRQGLRGLYYTNLTRTGPPVAIAIDESLSTDTLDNGTAGVWPAYAVEWTGFLVVDRAADYEFAVTSDDGSELAIDDRVVVANGGLHAAQEARGSIHLDEGLHPIRLRYEQAGGDFALEVRYGEAGRSLAPLPASHLTPDAITYREYRLRHAAPWAAAAIAVAVWIAARRRLSLGAFTPSATPAPWTRAATRRAIVAIVVAGAAVRLVVMLGSDAILWGDSDVFLLAVDNIRAGRYLDHDPFRTPLYSYFLAPFLSLSSEPPMDQVIVAAQHALGVAAAVCFFLAGRLAVGAVPALAGALLFTMHTTQLFYEISILSEALFVFILSIAILVIGRFVETPSLRRAIGAAAVCAALTYTRPVAQWFFLVPMAFVLARPAVAWRRRLAPAAAIAVTFAALMLPWVLLNQRQFGFSGIAIGQGFGLYIRAFDIERLDPPPDTRYPEARDALLEARAARRASPATYVLNALGRRYSLIERDAVMGGAATEAMLREPLQVAVGSLRQWQRQLSGPLGDEAICTSVEVGAYICSRRTVGYAREPFLNRPRFPNEPARAWVVRYFRYARIPITYLSVLAAFGVLALLAQPVSAAAQGILLALTIGYFTFLPAFAQSPQDRYRLPIDALLFILAAFGVMRLFGRGSSASANASARQATLVE